jgi:hypothetical protein
MGEGGESLELSVSRPLTLTLAGERESLGERALRPLPLELLE